MIQNNQPPDVLNLNAFASYAKDGLLYSGDEVLSPKTREDFLEAVRAGRRVPGQALRLPDPGERARLLLQHATCSPGPGVAGAAADLGRVRAGGEEGPGARAAATIGYALPLGPEEAQAEWSIWMWNNGGDWKAGDAWTINSDEERRRRSSSSPTSPTRHKVTQVNPGKTNRTDGAFQLFKDGKVGMVMGFSPLAAQLDAEGKVRYGVAQMPTNVGTPVTLGVEDYLMAFKKKGNQEAVKAVPRPLLPARAHHALDRGRGLPARDQVGPASA